jgi:CubicO group peptidase (beta-lactamase class C family)
MRTMKVLMTALLAMAAGYAQAQAVTSEPAAVTLTADDVGAFMDGLVPYGIEHGDVAGGVVVIVKDGKILFAKGYGFADVAKRAPVIPDQTLFRPGSVSKLFTWTAVMQQVEAGKLDLDTDVNQYLDFKIPPAFGKAITLRNLLTHTPGFEDNARAAFLENPSDLIPLRDYLLAHMPARIYPPGKVVAYSNYGASVAGYIVQRVSGEPFADYIANHILEPLGMDHSTFVQPLPARLAPDMAEGYLNASDKKTRPFEIIETAPAGALSATGTDMARFMIAHLQDGSYSGATILKPETAKLMHSPQSMMAPGMPGFCLGFYQEDRNGVRVISHEGDTYPFHSNLHLLLDKNVGIFMSFSSLGKDADVGKVRQAVFRKFMDRYYPYAPPEEKTIADPKPDAARVAGFYQFSRRTESALRILTAPGQIAATVHPDGTIEISALKDLAGNPKQWREVGPLMYREVNGQAHLKFVTDASGAVDYWVSDDFIPVLTFQRTHGLKQLSFFKVLASGFVAAIVLTVIIWFGGWLIRRRVHATLALTPQQRQLRTASRIGAVLVLLMLGAWLWFVVRVEAVNGAQSANKWLVLAYLFSVLGTLGVLAIIIEATSRVLRGPGGWLVRVSEAALLLVALYGLWAIFCYGMASFNFNW